MSGHSAENAATLPLDERMLFALQDAGLDESDALTAMEVISPLLAADLRVAAREAEWRYRSMAFNCGAGTSTTKLHPVGQWLRDRYARVFPPANAEPTS